jgi:hypothetical protein
MSWKTRMSHCYGVKRRTEVQSHLLVDMDKPSYFAHEYRLWWSRLGAAVASILLMSCGPGEFDAASFDQPAACKALYPKVAERLRPLEDVARGLGQIGEVFGGKAKPVPATTEAQFHAICSGIDAHVVWCALHDDKVETPACRVQFERMLTIDWTRLVSSVPVSTED